MLFYIRLVGDIGGRLVPKRFQATRVRALLMWAGVKTAMVGGGQGWGQGLGQGRQVYGVACQCDAWWMVG